MHSLRFLGVCLSLAVLAGMPVWGQSIVSAHSGLIHYVEGQASLDGKAIEQKSGVFTDVKEKGVLKTDDGRAEVLLTPGSFLRLAENSSVRMISTRLVDTRLEVLEGSVLVEVAEMSKDNAVTLVYKDATLSLLKAGLYRVDTNPAMVRVYKGELVAESGSQRVTLKDAKELNLGGVWAVNKFDSKTGDAFYRWASRRASYLSMANVSSARSAGGYGNSFTSSRWLWNPYMSMFTYMPYSGMYYSPFGYNFYSPQTVYRVYSPSQPVNRGGGYSSGSNNLGYTPMSHSSMGTSGAINSMRSAPSSSSSSASSGRAISSGSGGSGGATGGGRSR
jgi:DUF971 family protein